MGSGETRHSGKIITGDRKLNRGHECDMYEQDVDEEHVPQSTGYCREHQPRGSDASREIVMGLLPCVWNGGGAQGFGFPIPDYHQIRYWWAGGQW